MATKGTGQAGAHPEAGLLAARALRRTATEDERAVLERATAEILRLKREVARNFYELGYWLKRVRDESLFRARGHATFEAYLAKEVAFSRAHAYGFIRVAERLPPDYAVALGVEKAKAVVAYLDATPREETQAEAVAIQVPVVRGKGREIVPAARATVKEIQAAAAAVRGRRRLRERPKPPAEWAGFLRRAEPALRRAGISVATDGRAVTFGRIPFEKVGEFSARLAALVPKA